jgi:hypothetical protein
MIKYNVVLVSDNGEYDENFHIWTTSVPIIVGDILVIDEDNYQVFMTTRAYRGEEIFTIMVKHLIYEEEVTIE